jgi:hypothetical protein
MLHSLHLRHTTFFILIGFSGVEGKALDGDVLHLRRQSFPSFGKVGQNEDDDNANADGDDTLDDVQPNILVNSGVLLPAASRCHSPLPCTHSVVTGKTSQNTGRDKTAECTTEQ